MVKNSATCSIAGCYYRRVVCRKIQKFHLIPKNPDMHKKWLDAIKNAKLLKSTNEEIRKLYFVCPRHFLLSANGYLYLKRLKHDAVPTENLFEVMPVAPKNLPLGETSSTLNIKNNPYSPSIEKKFAKDSECTVASLSKSSLAVITSDAIHTLNVKNPINKENEVYLTCKDEILTADLEWNVAPALELMNTNIKVNEVPLTCWDETFKAELEPDADPTLKMTNADIKENEVSLTCTGEVLKVYFQQDAVPTLETTSTNIKENEAFYMDEVLNASLELAVENIWKLAVPTLEVTNTDIKENEISLTCTDEILKAKLVMDAVPTLEVTSSNNKENEVSLTCKDEILKADLELNAAPTLEGISTNIKENEVSNTDEVLKASLELAVENILKLAVPTLGVTNTVIKENEVSNMDEVLKASLEFAVENILNLAVPTLGVTNTVIKENEVSSNVNQDDYDLQQGTD